MLEAAWGGIKAVPVRRFISLLGILVALATAIFPPVSYALNAYWKEHTSLSSRAQTTAARAARFIQVAGEHWLTEFEPFAYATQIRSSGAEPTRQRMLTSNGAVVLQDNGVLAAPTTKALAPVVVKGQTVGHIEVSSSLRPLVLEVSLLALGTLALGAAAFFAFAVLPLRALDRTMTEIQDVNDRFKAQNDLLDTALSEMHQGLAMFDADERLVFANERCEALLELAPGSMKPGMTLDEIAAQRIATGLYGDLTTEELLVSVRRRLSTSEVAQVTRQLGNGRVLFVTMRPRGDGGWVTTYQDITEHHRLNTRLGEQNERLRQQEAELTARNLLLDTALETMSQALCMFDAERRVVICNSRYATMYGLKPEDVKPGTLLKDIVELRIAKGHYVKAGPQDYRRDRLASVRYPSNVISEMNDGRSIAIARRPMPGGGWITTHEDVTEHRQKEARIAHMALHDSLTDLPNRVLLNERLETALERAKDGGMSSACHLLDLDDFKNVNDTLGHPIGDKLLRRVAERLRTLLRDTDTIARMGGDEFAILQSGIAQPTDATGLAQRIIQVVSKPYDIDGHQVVIGTSIGIAIGPADGTTPEQLIRNADLALYRAKDEGRGTFSFFEPEMDGAMQARRAMECDLRKAQVQGEFELLYQPVVNLASNSVAGLEALIRWRHPEKGMIPPSEFISLAEEMGLIEPISEWVLRQACARAASWPNSLRIAVNLSPAQFRRPGLVQTVVSALASSGLPADRLELEITETSLLQNSEATLSTLYQLRELGVRIAMDDFGTGYSSLSYLQSFPFDKIKIDRSFVKDITDGVGSLNIVRAIVHMARGLGMNTTAEGVETQEQLEIVRNEGCTEMQGYLFARPLSAHEVDKLLKKEAKKRKAAAAVAA